MVVARDVNAFTERYGSENILLAGAFSGGLSNTSETLTVEGPTGADLIDFAYQSSWEPSTNGNGPSLVLQSPDLDPSLASSWRPSVENEGSPGRADTAGEFRVRGDMNGFPVASTLAM